MITFSQLFFSNDKNKMMLSKNVMHTGQPYNLCIAFLDSIISFLSLEENSCENVIICYWRRIAAWLCERIATMKSVVWLCICDEKICFKASRRWVHQMVCKKKIKKKKIPRLLSTYILSKKLMVSKYKSQNFLIICSFTKWLQQMIAAYINRMLQMA